MHATSDLTIRYPLDRWTLFLGGPTLGAAVMFWAIVIVVLIVAVGLSRLPNIPITTTDAVLFSLGATLINLWALLIVGAWFLATWVRSRKKEIDNRKFFYYLKQVAFIALSLVGLVMLVALVPSALLGSPEMHIAGNGSSWEQFNWFADVSGTTSAHSLGILVARLGFLTIHVGMVSLACICTSTLD